MQKDESAYKELCVDQRDSHSRISAPRIAIKRLHNLSIQDIEINYGINLWLSREIITDNPKRTASAPRMIHQQHLSIPIYYSTHTEPFSLMDSIWYLLIINFIL